MIQKIKQLFDNFDKLIKAEIKIAIGEFLIDLGFTQECDIMELEDEIKSLKLRVRELEKLTYSFATIKHDYLIEISRKISKTTKRGSAKNEVFRERAKNN